MSIWQDFKDKAEAWGNDLAKSWKDPEAADKAIGAATFGGLSPGGLFPEHDGWRKEIRQNISNREIDRDAAAFNDQLTNSLKDIKTPAPEIGKDRERER